MISIAWDLICYTTVYEQDTFISTNTKNAL